MADPRGSASGSFEGGGVRAAAGEWAAFVVGDELFRQAAPAQYWFLRLDGRVESFRRTGHDEQRVGTMDTPGQWAGGFRAWDQHGVYLATGRAVESGHLVRVPADRLPPGRASQAIWFGCWRTRLRPGRSTRS